MFPWLLQNFFSNHCHYKVDIYDLVSFSVCLSSFSEKWCNQFYLHFLLLCLFSRDYWKYIMVYIYINLKSTCIKETQEILSKPFKPYLQKFQGMLP